MAYKVEGRRRLIIEYILMLPHHINSKLKMQRVWAEKWKYIIVEDKIAEIVRFALRQVKFDEDWYLGQYSDIADAITSGEFSNARDHFVEYGFYEGRLPYRISVDENYYLEKYPDIKAAVKSGLHGSATDHFYTYGFQEGRLPHKDFTLFQAIPAEPQ